MKFKIRSTCIATVAQGVDEVHTARDAVAKQMQVIQLKEKKSKYRNSNGGASISSNRSTEITNVILYLQTLFCHSERSEESQKKEMKEILPSLRLVRMNCVKIQIKIKLKFHYIQYCSLQ